MSQLPNQRKLPRREFLANLLFAGGFLTVTALDERYPLLCRKDPPESGWEMPDNRKRDRPEQDDGWVLPEDLLTNPDPPPSNPSPPPQPAGGMKLPHPTPKGRFLPPVHKSE